MKIIYALATSLLLSSSAYADLAHDVVEATKDKKDTAAIDAAMNVKLYDAIICITKKDGKLIRRHTDTSLNGEVTDAEDKKIVDLFFAAAAVENRTIVSYKRNNKKYEAEVIRINNDSVCVVRTAGVQ